MAKDRVIIEKMLRAGCKKAEIARVIGCHERTLRRELDRGTCSQRNSDWTQRTEYLADYAQAKHEAAGRNKEPYPKLNDAPELQAWLEKKIRKEGFSPDAALMKAREEDLKFELEVSAKTVYNSVDRGDLDVTRKDLLRGKGWSKKERPKPRKGLHTKGKSIEERPLAANERSEPGHFEGDLIVGKNGTKLVLLTLTDRLTREEIIVKLPNKEQTSVLAAVPVGQNRPFDNGSEFLDFQRLERSVTGGKRFDVYYAHPYSSWERGSNENANGLIRRFFPKGTDFSKISVRRINNAATWINNYPRRILGGFSSSSFADRFCLDN